MARFGWNAEVGWVGLGSAELGPAERAPGWVRLGRAFTNDLVVLSSVELGWVGLG